MKVKHSLLHRFSCSPDDSGCGWSIMLGLCPGSRFPKVAGAAVGSHFAQRDGRRRSRVERSTGLRDLHGASHHFGGGLEVQADHLSSTQLSPCGGSKSAISGGLRTGRGTVFVSAAGHCGKDGAFLQKNHVVSGFDHCC